MKKAIKLISLMFLFLFVLSVSCTKDKEKDEPDVCGIENISFVADIQPIIEVKCFRCHNGPNANGGIRLDSYENAKAAANSGRLLGAILHKEGFTPMPKLGVLDSCQIVLFEEWVAKGLPE